MCARTTLTRKQLQEIADELDAEFSPEDARVYRPRFNAAPSETLWILRHGADRRVILPAAWGYVANGRSLINVRGERVGSGGGFREAFASRRCGVICDGFFEWNQRHEPTWFHRADDRLVVLGGLYQDTQGPRAVPRFAILTTRPNQLVRAVHDRMPLVLPPDRIDDWLLDEAPRAAELIVPAPEDVLVGTPVSTRVNSVKNDDAGCLHPVDRPTEPAQRSLF